MAGATLLVLAAVVAPVGAGDTPSEAGPAAGWGALRPGATASGSLPAEAIDEQAWRAPVAPGIDLLAVRRFDASGWLDLFAVLVDLSVPGVWVDALTPPALTSRQPMSQLAREAGAVAAINGDFFYAGATGAPVGLVVQGSRIVKGPGPEGRPSLAVLQTPAGLRAAVGSWELHAAAFAGAAVVPLTGWNEPAPRPGDVVGYDERWGPSPLPLGRYDRSEVAYARLNSLADGSSRWVVAAVGQGTPAPPGPGERVLLGWRQGARRVQEALRVDQEVFIDAYLRPSAATPAGQVVASVSGGSWLVRQGAVQVPDGAPGSPTAPHPRAAAGIDAGGTRLILVVADGRRPDSRGVTAEELGAWMVRLGAFDALNLDGGGSATLVANLTGRAPEVINRPSGIQERPVPVGIGVFYRPPSSAGGTDPAGPFVIRPSVGLRPPPLDRYGFDFAGLVTAAGVPARLEVVPPFDPGRLLWSVDPPDLGLMALPGQFVGLRPGEGRIVAVRLPDGPGSWQRAASVTDPQASVERTARSVPTRLAPVASLPVRVIGPPRALVVEPAPVQAAPGEQVVLEAAVVDDQGRKAPLSPGLVAWWLEGAVDGSVAGGVLQGWPGRPGEPARVQARYLDLRAEVPIEWKVDPQAGSPEAGTSFPAGTSASPDPRAGTFLDPAARLTPTGWTPEPAPPVPAPETVRVAVWVDPGDPSAHQALSRWVQEHGVHLLVLLSPGAVAGPEFGVPVLAARVPDRAGASVSTFMRRFGSPTAVATRGRTRFVTVDPAVSPWSWLAGQLRRALDERVTRLVAIMGQDPRAWPSRREGEMVLAWLARAAELGMEAWAVFPGAEGQARVWLEQGVVFAALPVHTSGGPQLGLVLDVAPDRLSVHAESLTVPEPVEQPDAYAGLPQAPIPTHSSPSS